MGWFDKRRRGTPQFDPYEAAAGRMERSRRATEMGDVGPPPPGVELPAMQRPRWKLALLVIAVALLAGIVQSNRQAAAPKLAADCTRSQLRLSPNEVRQGRPVRWSATGANGAVILAVDVQSFAKGAGGRYVVRPLPGHSVDQTQAASREVRLQGCAAAGLFGATVPPGEHTVTMFRLTGTGSTPLVSAKLTVDNP